MKRIISVLFLQFFVIALAVSQINVNEFVTVGNCLSYVVNGNQVEFQCDNHIQVGLKICNASVIRLWYQVGQVIDSHHSFAVENDNLEDVGKINITELEQLTKEFKSNRVALEILRLRVKAYIYNNYVDYKSAS